MNEKLYKHIYRQKINEIKIDLIIKPARRAPSFRFMLE